MRLRRIICLLVMITMVFSMTTITADAASFKAAPKSVKAKCVNGASVKVSCKTKKGATGYEFYYSLKKGGKYTLGATSTSRKAVVKGLTAGKKYYFKVRAFKGTTVKTYTKMSKAAKCKTELKKPTITVTDKCDCKIYMTLRCQEGTKGFAVYRSNQKKKGYKKIATISSGASVKWTNTGLKANTTYYYKVKAVSGKYSSDESKVLAVKTAAWHRNGNDNYFNPTGSYAKSYNLKNGGNNAMTGHEMFFLGSSITKGSGSDEYSFADYIRERNGAKVTKEAVSSTTMSGPDVADSYVSRLANYPFSGYYPDVFVCQLSLNDSFLKNNIDIGELPEIDFDSLSDADLESLYEGATTVAGSIAYITAFAYKKWPDCQVVFFTVRNNGGKKYAEMRTLLYEAKAKYGKYALSYKDLAGEGATGFEDRNRIEIIDMWSVSALTNIKGNNYCMYMNDANHPKKAGYLYQWTPVFESSLIAWMPPRYTVTWKNGDTVLEKDRNVRGRVAPSYDGEEPTKPDDEEFTYTFVGWEDENGERLNSGTKVTGDVTFTAVFDATAKPDDPDASGGDGKQIVNAPAGNDQGGQGGQDSDELPAAGDGNGNDGGAGGGGTDGDGSDGGSDDDSGDPSITGMIQSLLRAA